MLIHAVYYYAIAWAVLQVATLLGAIDTGKISTMRYNLPIVQSHS